MTFVTDRIIPGFGAGAHAPTAETLEFLRQAGVFPNAIRCFVNREHYQSQPGGEPAPINGSPKYWANPYANRAPLYLFMRRDAMGRYIAKKPSRHSYPENQIFSLSAFNFYDSRQSVTIPELEVRAIDYNEAGRLSFPFNSIEDPVDYPIAEINAPNQIGGHTFPGTWVLFMKDGLPHVITIDEANKMFPVTWGPQEPGQTPSGGFTADQVVGLAQKLTFNSTSRMAAFQVLDGAGDAEDKAKRLVTI